MSVPQTSTGAQAVGSSNMATLDHFQDVANPEAARVGEACFLYHDFPKHSTEAV